MVRPELYGNLDHCGDALIDLGAGNVYQFHNTWTNFPMIIGSLILLKFTNQRISVGLFFVGVFSAIYHATSRKTTFMMDIAAMNAVVGVEFHEIAPLLKFMPRGNTLYFLSCINVAVPLIVVNLLMEFEFDPLFTW